MADRTRAFNWNGGSSNSQSGTGFPSYGTSAPAAVSLLVIPAHYLLGFHAANLTGNALWVQVFDASAQPASTTVPLRSYPIASAGAAASTGLGGGTLDIDFPGDGRYFQTGIVLAFSSVASVLEIASVASTGLFDVQFQ